MTANHPIHCVRGFTLVELLTVVAIIAVLVAILLPSLNKARAAARRVLCLSHQHQSYLALQSYAVDWNGLVLAKTTAGGHINLWPQFIAASTASWANGRTPYIADPRVLGCPSNARYKQDFVDKDISEVDNAAFAIYLKGHSEWNFVRTIKLYPAFNEGKDKYPWPNPDPYDLVVQQLSAVPIPSDIIMLADSIHSEFAANDADPENGMKANFETNRQSNFWARIHLIHDGKANYSFYDGHATAGDAIDMNNTASQCRYFFEQNGVSLTLP